MPPDLHVLTAVVAALRYRLTEVRAARDAGYSTETVLVVGALATLALAVLGIITAKVLAKANAINLG